MLNPIPDETQPQGDVTILASPHKLILVGSRGCQTYLEELDAKSFRSIPYVSVAKIYDHRQAVVASQSKDIESEVHYQRFQSAFILENIKILPLMDQYTRFACARHAQTE